jgi:hypothetical protein
MQEILNNMMATILLYNHLSVKKTEYSFPSMLVLIIIEDTGLIYSLMDPEDGVLDDSQNLP